MVWVDTRAGPSGPPHVKDAVYDILQVFDTDFDDDIYVDGIFLSADYGESGTERPIGTRARPANTLANARTIADAENVKRITILDNSAYTMTQAYQDFEIRAEYHFPSINLNGQILTGTSFEHVTIYGTGSPFVVTECQVINWSGGSIFFRSVIGYTITATSAINFIQCSIAAAQIDFANYGHNLFDSDGKVYATDMTGGTVNHYGNGQIEFQSGCTGGYYYFSGELGITDNSNGTVIERFEPDALIVTRGNVSSSGSDYVTGTTGSFPSLSATDDIYKDSLLTIFEGTGAGQTRLITGYTASTRRFDVFPDWDVNPTIGSAYAVRSTNVGSVLDTQRTDHTEAGTIGEAVTYMRDGTLASDIDVVLSAAHGSNSWEGGGTDWTDDEKKQIRDALGVSGDTLASVGGQLQNILNFLVGKWKIENNQMIFYVGDTDVVLYRFNLFDQNGNPSNENTFLRRPV
jgi:hypothetical protein